MANPSYYRKCVHCLGDFEELTSDHLIPKSWYPETTPENLEKWKIPSCKKCNQEYGKLENDLLIRLGMCIGPEDALAAGIGEKALRSIKPEFAKNDHDRKIREAKREQIKKEVFKLERPNEEGILPNFEAQPYLSYDEHLAIPIPADSLKRFAIKVARGITFLKTGKFIPNTHKINVYFLKDEDSKSVLELIRRKGHVHSRGPGVIIEHAPAFDDGISSLLHVTLWGRLKFFVLIYPLEREKEITDELQEEVHLTTGST